MSGMEALLLILFVLALLVLSVSFLLRQKKKQPVIVLPIPDQYKAILQEQVEFYKQLEESKQQEFETRIQLFLSQTKITGVRTTVEDIDKVLIASSAIIPIFGFPGWEYVNLQEVLLYPDYFNHDFEQTGSNRNILGMVGSGAMNGVMILSQHELRQVFLNKTGKTNTAIHEFVHLVDKTDGSVDGIPEFILQQQYILPWLQLMRQEIKKILADDSDINPYGTTNEAEFFAVVAEYFFERPDLLQEKHPELYQLLTTIFRQQPATI
jgi:Mlc titration factor MtfA (ptsG expression regulator)